MFGDGLPPHPVRMPMPNRLTVKLTARASTGRRRRTRREKEGTRLDIRFRIPLISKKVLFPLRVKNCGTEDVKQPGTGFDYNTEVRSCPMEKASVAEQQPMGTTQANVEKLSP
jgi:hypothetical protein